MRPAKSFNITSTSAAQSAYIRLLCLPSKLPRIIFICLKAVNSAQTSCHNTTRCESHKMAIRLQEGILLAGIIAAKAFGLKMLFEVKGVS